MRRERTLSDQIGSQYFRIQIVLTISAQTRLKARSGRIKQELKKLNRRFDARAKKEKELTREKSTLTRETRALELAYGRRQLEALDETVEAPCRRCSSACIIIRADSEFCRESILIWCEEHGGGYVSVLARTSRLAAELKPVLAQVLDRSMSARGH